MTMRTFPTLVLASLAVTFTTACSHMFEKTTEKAPQAASRSLHEFRVESLDGGTRDLADYRGRVVLVVNTASECGFTKQYAGMQKLQERFNARGFDVLAFPCNDFGGQEPGTSTQIAQFCSTQYATTFPIFGKVGVKSGPEQAPLYAWLGEATGKLPGWNFGKYLIGKDGKPIAFWASTVEPEAAEVTAAIEKALG